MVKTPDDVLALFKDLLDGYVNDLLDDPHGCVKSPKELKDEIALVIKAGRFVGLDVAAKFNPPVEEKKSEPGNKSKA